MSDGIFSTAVRRRKSSTIFVICGQYEFIFFNFCLQTLKNYIAQPGVSSTVPKETQKFLGGRLGRDQNFLDGTDRDEIFKGQQNVQD